MNETLKSDIPGRLPQLPRNEISPINYPKKTRNEIREERRREIRLRRSMLLENPKERSITYKVAQETSELEDAFSLVWKSYKEVGLQADDSMGIRFTKYHLLPTTRVLIAVHKPELEKDNPDYNVVKNQGEIVGTLTIVLDTEFGLPMDELCGLELDNLRAQDRSIAEIIAFSIKPEYRQYNVMMYLYKMLLSYVKMKHITDVACSVTRKHISFYRRMLLFEAVGEMKKYSAANGLDTQGHLLNIERAETEGKKIYSSHDFDADLHNFFFSENPAVNKPLGEGYPWTQEQLRYFLTERTSFVNTLDKDTKKRLRNIYNQYGLSFNY